MLEELLSEFGDHQVQYPEFDPDTMVLTNYHLKPGLYVRLNEDGSKEEIYIGKKTEPPENTPLVDWFKQADFASSLIEMNKPVDPKKQIHSCNYLSLFCKRDTFWQDGNVHPKLPEHIERYFAALSAVKDKESARILATAGYGPLKEEQVAAGKERFLASLAEVGELVKAYNIKDNSYVKLFLNASLETYIYESGRYLLPRIFNNNKYNVEVGGNVFGLSNTDMGMNAKKPYLEHKTTQFEVPYRITAEEAVLLRKLFLWLNGQTREGKVVYGGYVQVGVHDPGLLVQRRDVSVRKPVVYLHFDRRMDLSVDHYDFLPSFADRMDRPVTFRNFVDAPKYQGGKLDRLSAVEAHINENLYAFQLVRSYDEERIQVTDKLPQVLASQIVLSREAMRAWLRKGDSLPIQNSVDRMTKGVILARLQNLEYVPALGHALNVRFSLLNYFDKGGNDMGYAIEETYRGLKEKVLNTEKRKESAACQNAVEFYLAVGQLLYYYFSLSEAQKLHYDVLWRGIASAKDLEGIKKEHWKYFQKYSYAIDTNNPRFNNMLSVVSSYTPEQDEPINLDALLYGFAANSIIYYKEDSNEKD
ncbi:hypothetical protein CEB3_c33750 [Peptococcaceae bacterium CEB3]|nr:hypothetical protein CEB3_c33750 [Peptococcaceae bacterium CEB3]